MKHTGKPNTWERMLAVVSPKKALERYCYRTALERSVYAAANQGRVSEGWTTLNGTAETMNRAERDIVRARARDLERNSDMLPAEILALERNVVGTGIVLQAKIAGDDSGEDEELNSRIEELWKLWCRPENCDITGRMSFSEMQQMVVRRRFVDGGVLIIKVYENDQLRLQMLEVDDLDTTLQMAGSNRVVGGIEINAYGRPLAYHIKEADVYGFTAKSVRVAADRVIYLPILTRPKQVREFSPAAPSLPRIDDVNEFISSAVEKERVLSYLSVFIESTGLGGGFGGLGRGVQTNSGGGGYSSNERVLEQGAIVNLAPGEKVSTINPSGVSSTAHDMVRLTQRLAGSSAGLSYEATSRDMSQVNYSSARQGMLEDQRTYKQWQQYLITHLCDNVYLEWLDWMVMSGRLSLKNYFRDKPKYQRHTWIASGWEWIDPVKESNANAKALETNQKTLQEICSEKGKDWRDVIRQRAIEKQLIQEMQTEEGEEQPSAKKNTILNN
ncbi:lambda family phage portal protein [Hydrogenoanaerobacterium saccharovorans]|uniref:Phage portal protein, lambda family n=1 Tax=Hydrogenoanaerobacterium saccharovorans TaxID=474960 RepID=A0A1H7YH05_9FIRM|nr:phage portal protein [Hydrogenoanaerobacterium saccharovorans]RPF41905.1 lambda family phage portal protein [Hydrogenoanaerobacterium saccharovorans]SEM45546.1 phage portal protein, lambda family [Hydrogenoanaerobacterium saccharovorans]